MPCHHGLIGTYVSRFSLTVFVILTVTPNSQPSGILSPVELSIIPFNIRKVIELGVWLSRIRILGAGEALLFEIFTPADIELGEVFGTILPNLQVQSPKLWNGGSTKGPWMGISQLVVVRGRHDVFDV